MSRRARTLRLMLALITSLLAVLAVTASILAVRYQNRIADASRYNKAFDLAQAAGELIRLEIAVAARLAAGTGLGEGDVDLRYQIVAGRARSFAQGEVSKFGASSSETRGLFQDLEAVLHEVEPLLAAIDDPKVVGHVIALLNPLHLRIARLSSMAHAEGGDVVAALQEDLLYVFASLCAVIVALVCFGVALLAVVFRQTTKAGLLARQDALTGIDNRFALNLKLGSMRGGRQQAILLLDVDDFKDINDTLGHDQGDRFLVALSTRLAGIVEGASLFARLGGDEFAIIFEGPLAQDRAEGCAERILQALQTPLAVGSQSIAASVSLGIAIHQPGGEAFDAVVLLKHADLALYAAKANGRGQYRIYDPEMNRTLQRRQDLVRGLSSAIANRELFLAFQPVVDLSDHRIRGFEALLRWRHSELGPISPAEFIPVAEDSGLIVDIGRWTIEQAVAAASKWPERISISINVSARQFADPLLSRCIEAALARHRVSPTRLVVEITESVLIENDEVVLGVLARLRELGVSISLDDFGTGYASLGYLRRFRFDKLKIDQSFVRSSELGSSSLAIVSAICTLALSLGLEIVAEGIETVEHRDLVHDAGCHLGQGYLFDRPLSAEAATSRVVLDAVLGAVPPRPIPNARLVPRLARSVA